MTVENQYHYQLVKRAISIIDETHAPLSLPNLAAKMNMSPSHFQKTFREWAGVSPKKYQSYLTLSHAKSLLLNHQSTLRTAHEVGLSGSSRLHDLFISWEAMTPGEFAQKGAGLMINYDRVSTPFGDAIMMATSRGLCGLGFLDDCGYDATFSDLTARWPKAHFQHSPKAIAPYHERAFAKNGAVKLHLMGTALQIKTWEALMSIPSGYVTTYSDIAGAINRPKAQRAIGTAIGRNPVGWIIPCHRALRKSGALGGYRWGLTTKRAMLAYEAIRRDAQAENHRPAP